MAEPVALAALALDGALGWPAWLYRRVGHPVGAFARIILACERVWNRPELSGRQRRSLGFLTVALLAGGTALAALLAEMSIRHLAGPAAWPLIALAAWPALAQRSLYDHYLPVLAALERGDLAAARQAVGMIVGRDTGVLDEAGVARAAIESLAESFCDGIVAPLFWLAVLGLPGVWGYKAINTADSLIGHPEEPLRAFGWAAARSDDIVNLIPARLAGVLICIAGGGGWRVLRRDCRNHASPNAGWPEAAMAGALRARLAGPVSYDGHLRDKPWIGEGADASPAAMRGARNVYLRACGLLWLVGGGLAWLA
ncbi:cobalamin biosynthesis protein CobD [Novosphingobium endophyticum]|uniref:Cobalamin biosynthesis protein CobD n=1 Tax=Novosphingobium endophyticum TaxID=1955250 RepID=A0A916TRV3_9SPHN|nr:adenosylcobinamide-phosphate synthase CbiB [Novosphingobium endophyticum]GGB98897.1 cobalamin biosynthesis protein CobD [Novosphingobium endophyticum]